MARKQKIILTGIGLQYLFYSDTCMLITLHMHGFLLANTAHTGDLTSSPLCATAAIISTDHMPKDR